jgi:alpha/beta hydrolase family protein
VWLIHKFSVLRPKGLTKSQSNVILYLPPGLLFRHDPSRIDNNNGQVASADGRDDHSDPTWPWSGGLDNKLSPQHILASTTLSTVVTVNYRLGAQSNSSLVDARSPAAFYKFPTPVHDTSAGFDWILRNLHPARLSVFGSHVGGSLALMLALTEASVVKAVAVFEPICDWVGLDDYCLIPSDAEESARARKTGLWEGTMDEKMGMYSELQAPVMQQQANPRRGLIAAPPDLASLLGAREQLFDAPGRYFDPFASPILFLRTPGRDCPDESPSYHTGPEYPFPVLKRPKPKTDHMDYGYVRIQPQENVQDGESHLHVRRNKALLRWPPFGVAICALEASSRNADIIRRLQVSLPMVRIFARDTEAFKEGSDRASSCSFVKNQDSKPDGQHLIPNFSIEDQEPGKRKSAKGQPSSRPVSPRQDTVLMGQAKEMVSLMRKACFWGHEKGRANDKVRLIRSPPMASPLNKGITSDPSKTVEKEAAEWFRSLSVHRL